jgi:NAD(P)H-flavin reductase
LDPKNFKEFKLVKKTQISPNAARFKFALPTPKSILGLPVGKNILVRFEKDSPYIALVVSFKKELSIICSDR